MLGTLRSWLKRASFQATVLIELGGVAVAAFVIWWYRAPIDAFVPRSFFALFAFLPGVLGFVNHFTSTLPRYRATRAAVLDYESFCDGFDAWWRTVGWPRKVGLAGLTQSHAGDFARVVKRARSRDSLLAFRPMIAAAIWSSLALTT